MSRKIGQAIFDSDLIATRVTLAVAEMLWAILLWWPGATFDRPTYAVMVAMAPEDAWGAVFAASAACQLGIVASGRFLSRPARWFAFWNAALWCTTVLAMLAAVQPPPAAISGEIAMALAAAWIWLRPVVLSTWYWRAYGRAHA